MRSFPLRFVAAFAMLTGSLSCGGSSPTVPAPPVPTTTLAPQPSPTPSPAPSPSPTAGTQACNLAPGPVARLAVSPRAQRTAGSDTQIHVRVQPEYSGETWCLDQDKSHVIDFNATQKNGATPSKECCYVGDVEWTIGDPSFIVNGRSSRHDDGFIYRLNIEPRGRATSVDVSAVLDGVRSHAWQSGSFYPQGPLRILTMPASQITRECTCVYKGNGVYEGNTCPKPKV